MRARHLKSLMAKMPSPCVNSSESLLEIPIRVLLVEDDSEDALLLQEAMKEAVGKFEVETAVRLEPALERLSQGGIDIVLSDLSLPDSTGLETFERLFAHAAKTPIIILSGRLDEALALETVKRGAQEYLMKGEITGAMLARSIRYAIERMAAKRALAAERNLLRNVIDNLVDAIYVKDLDGRFLLGNLAHAKQNGFSSPEEVVGKHTRDLYLAETAERFLADDRRVLHEGLQVLNRHERVEDPQGRDRWLSITKVPLRDVEGRVMGLVGIGRDITGRKQAEEQLARYTRELQERNSELEDDLKMAREVQMAFLPQQFPSFPRKAPPEESALRFYSRYFPATVLGGDFFHVLPISETAAGVLICDVMGHGVRAALVTAIHRALMEELQAFAADPAAFLGQMNQALLSILRRTRSPMFASAFYLAVDVATGRMQYANAGHPRPLHVRRAADQTLLLGSAGSRPGPALGVFEGTTYANHECSVAERDLVVLFTDGLYEVENREGELFDQTHLLRAVQARAQLPTEAIFDQTIAQVQEYSQNVTFADDVCLVGVEVCAIGAHLAGVDLQRSDAKP